jgi:SAM-dependent methyltransferase
LDPFRAYADLYDLDYADQQADLLMIRQFATRCGSPVLELGCGTGRLLAALAQDGHQVTGIDVSASMLERARRRIAAAGLADRVTLLEQDMRSLAVEERFQLAFAVSNSFMHLLTPEDQQRALVRVESHLAPGGLLVLDLFHPDPGRLLDSRGAVTLDKVMADPETGDRLMKFQTQTVDLARQWVHVTLFVDRVEADGRVQRTLFPFSLRYLYPGEVEHLLSRAGLEVEALYGSYDLDAFDDQSERMIAVARRRD